MSENEKDSLGKEPRITVEFDIDTILDILEFIKNAKKKEEAKRKASNNDKKDEKDDKDDDGDQQTVEN